ncbi:MAG: hypothetical protein IJL04_01285 [Bacteroidales bacterium]|nr:hypothetical protein [Bacteroidales bacterium]
MSDHHFNISATTVNIFIGATEKEPKAQAPGSDEITPKDVAGMLRRILQEDETKHH